jgi:hypothetical protein
MVNIQSRPVGHMRAHRGQPFQGIEYFLLFAVFGLIEELAFFRDIGHSLL